MYAGLAPLERATSPFETEPETNEQAHWVKPRVVAEVKFSEWTSDGRLRQPIFLGMRDDKDPRRVTREPASVPKKDTRPVAKSRSAPDALQSVIDALDRIHTSGKDGTIDLPEGTSLKVTTLNKVYFPKERWTKGDVLRYYVRVSPALLPLMADRPLVLQRHPEGIDGPSFFQQNAPEGLPAGVRVEEVPTDEGKERRFVGGNLTTLLYCVQMGTISVNPWHSRIGSLDAPDYTILDLDPGPKTTFKTIVRVARRLEELLDDMKVNAGLKTSGSRGLHIVIPLPSGTNEAAAQLVAQVFAERVALAHPKQATVERRRRQRSDSAVYVDYLQNVVGKSVAAAFSVRARPGATVSTPLAWEELTDRVNPRAFTIATVPAEMTERARMWNAMLKKGNTLRKLLAGGLAGKA